MISPDEKTHNQTDHVLIDRKWHTSVLDVRIFRGADCDTDRHMIIANVRKRLSVSKLSTQNSDVEKFILKQVSDLKVRKQYQTKISNGFQLYRTCVRART